MGLCNPGPGVQAEHQISIVKILLTGNAGFIGFHMASYLIQDGHKVIGVDSVNDYYDTRLKRARLAELDRCSVGAKGEYLSVELDLSVADSVKDALSNESYDLILHLAAQPGIKYSITDPLSYINDNLVAFANILEIARAAEVEHLVYASTSSVYGANRNLPFSEHDDANHPLQLYAATKRANELMAHSYSNLYGIPTTGIRFFTVYGPWGRPDMSLFTFVEKILSGEPIQLFNFGRQTRDFTYIDDAVKSVASVLPKPPTTSGTWDPGHPDPATSASPFRILNVGGGVSIPLNEYVEAIEAALGKEAVRELQPGSPAEMKDSLADTQAQRELLDFAPQTTVREGVAEFVAWYRSYYGV